MPIKNSTLIDGRHLAGQILAKLKADVSYYKEKHNLEAKLAIILIGDDPASSIYVGNKIKAAKEVGISTILKKLPTDITERYLLEEIEKLNQDNSVSGIIIQLPLPAHISKSKIISVIHPSKDVDGFHPINVGLLYGGDNGGFVPCTAKGVLALIKNCKSDISGMNAVVIGRSNIVGRPVAALLLQENCTVTICHSRTKNLSEFTKNADIVVSAIGKPKILGAESFNSKAIVIDVGINRITLDNRCELVGDIDFNNVKDKVSYITPVPGGVGPMTVAYLLVNTFDAMKKQNNPG